MQPERPRGVRAPPRGPLGRVRLRDPRARARRAYAAALAADPAAAAFWAAATPSYRKLAVNWVMTAKQETTRDARAATLVDDCAAGRLIKGQRYGATPTWVERAAAAAEAARLG